MPRCARFALTAAVVAVLSASLAAVASYKNSPSSDEASHLAAGVFSWQRGSFSLYPVNPPLVRAVAALPVTLHSATTDWNDWEPEDSKRVPESRPEWSVGIGFVRGNLGFAQWYFAVARWACLPFALLGAYCVWQWARDLYGNWAGLGAIALWMLSPNMLAWSATICPDAAAAALGVAAGYLFWRWLREPNWGNAVAAGVSLGLAQLAKLTWVVLFALWPLVWFLWRLTGPKNLPSVRGMGQGAQLATALAIAVLTLNLGYAFEGSLTRLGEFTFVSRTLAGDDSLAEGGRGGNRFGETWLGLLPVSLPYNYLRGMDLQKYDFERGLPSYLCGRWRDCGWWHYYLACAALKVPVGTWCLGFLAATLSAWALFKRPSERSAAASVTEAATRRDDSWRDEMVLLLPAAVLFVFVSSQTGFSRHFRYVLPAFPFLFIWISKIAPVAIRHPRTLGALAVGLLTWSVSSSMWIYPHSMSYFNELAGGPQNGDKYLLDSNLDWGQDVFYLKRWWEQHPEATPLNTLFTNSYGADLLGTPDWAEWNARGEAAEAAGSASGEERWAGAPFPGWYAVSVRRIHDADGDYLYFLRLQPVAMAGYGFRIYHITLEEANRVRTEIGEPLLPTDWRRDDDYPPPSQAHRAFTAEIAQRSHVRECCSTPIRVALFQVDPGSEKATAALKRLLADSADFRCLHVSAEDIRAHVLDECDLIIFPGGAAGAMARSLGEEGRAAVCEFVSGGGGYLGICGGAFLATANYDWSLGLVNAQKPPSRDEPGAWRIRHHGGSGDCAIGCGTQ